MSDLLNQASLVMVPSGYKEDTVYSVVPSDGSGDLSFTRASNGTRVNSAGLVEVCPWNLADQSNTFGTSPWSNTLDTGATLTYTANYGTAPDGTTTAGRLQMALNGSNYAQKNQIISVITGQQYTYSVWIKSLSGNKNVIFCYDNTNNITASVTTEWQRFTHTFTGNSQVYARFVLEAGTSTSVDLLIYGAQLNIGSTAKPYFPTTDRLNVPRLTYQNGGGGCPSLLLEKQSTNILPYSQDFSYWTIGSMTRNDNSTTSPDGTQNATQIIPNTSFVTHPLYYVYNIGGACTYSVFFKSSGYNYAQLYGGNASSSTNRFSVVVNLTSGTIDTSDNVTSSDVKIENYGNGWWRVSVYYSGYTGTSTFMAGTAIPQSGMSRNSYLDVEYSGNGTSGVYVWGAQCEQSTYVTSYIPSNGSSATRVADECRKTGISSLIGQTEGTLYAEFVHNGADILTTQMVMSINSGNTQNFVNIGVYNGQLNPAVRASSVDIFDLYVGPAPLPSGTHKIALAYKSGDFKIYLNGSDVYTNTNSATFGTMGQLDLGTLLSFGLQLGESIKEAVLFKTRLTNAELASLTTI